MITPPELCSARPPATPSLRKAVLSICQSLPANLQLCCGHAPQTSHDVEKLGNFLNESVAAGMEGLIVKSLDSTYEPSKRSVNWLKLKKDYLEGVGDTFDVVVIGAWHGRWALMPAHHSSTCCLHGAGGLSSTLACA